jgi:hypothetical protein
MLVGLNQRWKGLCSLQTDIRWFLRLEDSTSSLYRLTSMMIGGGSKKLGSGLIVVCDLSWVLLLLSSLNRGVNKEFKSPSNVCYLKH